MDLRTVIEELEATGRIVVPIIARDGDCLAVSAQVTQALTDRGVQAATVTVWGWVDRSSKVLGFVHQATAVGDTIVDLTATQFDRSLPAVWVVEAPAYLTALAEATGAAEVTLGAPGATAGRIVAQTTGRAYRGVSVPLNEHDGVALLLALAAGKTNVAHQTLIEAMAAMPKDRWWAMVEVPDDEAGRWWVSYKDEAVKFAALPAGQSIGWLSVPVVMTANVEESWEPYAEPWTLAGVTVWHLPVGHPLTVESFEATLPDDPQGLLDTWMANRQREPGYQWEGRRSVRLNIPPMRTTAVGWRDHGTVENQVETAMNMWRRSFGQSQRLTEGASGKASNDEYNHYGAVLVQAIEQAPRQRYGYRVDHQRVRKGQRVDFALVAVAEGSESAIGFESFSDLLQVGDPRGNWYELLDFPALAYPDGQEYITSGIFEVEQVRDWSPSWEDNGDPRLKGKRTLATMRYVGPSAQTSRKTVVRASRRVSPRAARGFPCFIPHIGREAVAMARRMSKGTATVEDILRCATDNWMSGVGTQWGLGGSEFGSNWEDDGAESYAFVDDDTIVREWIERNVEGGWSATDEEIWAEMGDNVGELQVILIGETDAEYTDMEWDASIGSGQEIRLIELRYNAGWGWKHLPANGKTVTSKRTASKTALGKKMWRSVVLKLPLKDLIEDRNIPELVLETLKEGRERNWANPHPEKGLGVHWTSEKEIAQTFSDMENFAQTRYSECRGDPVVTVPVVIEGRVPVGNVRSDPEVIKDYQMVQYDQRYDLPVAEEEVPVAKGAPVLVEAIELWLPSDKRLREMYNTVLSTGFGGYPSRMGSWKRYPVNMTVTAGMKTEVYRGVKPSHHWDGSTVRLNIPPMRTTAADVDSYGGSHRPTKDGPPAYDLLSQEGEAWGPDDVYEHPQYYTGYAQDGLRETMRTLRVCRGKPDALITIYRAIPPQYVGEGISTGDWISLSESYARQHAMAESADDDWPVVTAQVPARTVRWALDDLMEFGYWGPPISARTAARQNPSDGASKTAVAGPDDGLWWHWSWSGELAHDDWIHAGTKKAAQERAAFAGYRSKGEDQYLRLRLRGNDLNSPSNPVSDGITNVLISTPVSRLLANVEYYEQYGEDIEVDRSSKRDVKGWAKTFREIADKMVAGQTGAIYYVNRFEDKESISVVAPRANWEVVDVRKQAKTASVPTALYHLTDKVDFKLDPKKRPANNTTLGGDMPPGIFLGKSVESWVNGYGYWRPWVVEFSAPSDLDQLDGVIGGYSGEVFVPAEHYDKLRITRVLPLDAYCREEFGGWGWTEDHFGTTFDTEEPISVKDLNNYSIHRGYRYPGDARQTSSEWQQRYKKRIVKFRRTRTNAIASKTASRWAIEMEVGGERETIWEGDATDARDAALKWADDTGMDLDEPRLDDMEPIGMWEEDDTPIPAFEVGIGRGRMLTIYKTVYAERAFMGDGLPGVAADELITEWKESPVLWGDIEGRWREVLPGCWVYDHGDGRRAAYDRDAMTPESQAKFRAQFGDTARFAWQRYVNSFLPGLKDGGKILEGTAASLEAAQAKALKVGQAELEEARRKSEERTRKLIPDWGTPKEAAFGGSLTSVVDDLITTGEIEIPSYLSFQCIDTSNEVTEALRAKGVRAYSVSVYAFLKGELIYIHQVTIVGDEIVDLTAGQFDKSAPPVWVARQADYLRDIARYMKCDAAEIRWEVATEDGDMVAVHKTASKVADLSGRRLWWRSHPFDREFMPDAATSKPFYNVGVPEFAEGFSCFKDPWHLWLYAFHIHMDTQRSEVIGFTGDRVGEGWDGEPLAVPDGGIVMRFSWSDFERELLTTPLPRTPLFLEGFGAQYQTWQGLVKHYQGMIGHPVFDRIVEQVGLPSRLPRRSTGGWAATEVDEGTITRRDFDTPMRKGDWWFYAREEDLRAAGLPSGQLFDDAAQAQRYVDTVLRREGISEPCTVILGEERTGVSGAVWAKDMSRSMIVLSGGHHTEALLLHELAHIVYRKKKRGGASHGQGYAAVYARLLWEQMGVRLDLGLGALSRCKNPSTLKSMGNTELIRLNIRIGMATGAANEVPPPPGQTPLPPGTFRGFHYTPAENLDSIRRDGLRLDRARGHRADEPDWIWFAGTPHYWSETDSSKVLVEVAIPNGTYLANGGPLGNFALAQDVPSSWIIAVHEAWHAHYRYLLDYAEDVKAGDFDHALDMPDYRRAIELIKQLDGSRE